MGPVVRTSKHMEVLLVTQMWVLFHSCVYMSAVAQRLLSNTFISWLHDIKWHLHSSMAFGFLLTTFSFILTVAIILSQLSIFDGRYDTE